MPVKRLLAPLLVSSALFYVFTAPSFAQTTLQQVRGNADVASTNISLTPLRVEGYATSGDGGAHIMVYDSDNACGAGGHPATDGVTCINSTVGSGSWNIDWASVGEVAPAPVFGAFCKGDGGAADADTAGLQAAAKTGMSVYLPTNNYCILNGPINLSVQGQKMYGDGPQASKILVYKIFGSQENGTFTQGTINLTAPAEEVRGIGMRFSQPSVASNGNGGTRPVMRSDLTTYQPAIMARQAATVLDDLLIQGPTTCIDMGGGADAGNSYITDVDTGCYDYGIRLDGAVDTVHITRHHSYPFQNDDASGNLPAVFQRADNVAIDMGRVDAFAISDSLCLGETCLNLYGASDGGAFGTVTGYDFDGAATGIHMSTANASLIGAALTFSSGSAAESAIVQTSGKLMISASSMFTGAVTSMVQMTGGVLSITGTELNQGQFDGPFITTKCSGNANPPTVNGTSATPCRVTLVGNTIERDPSVAFNNPWLSSQGNEIVVGSSNSVTPTTAKINGTVTPPAVSIASDTLGNRWVGNSSPGWNNYVANAPMPDGLTVTQGGGRYFGN